MGIPVLETNIANLYQAGKYYIPQAAEKVADASLYLISPVESLDVGAADAGDPTVMRDMLWVLGRVSAALVEGTVCLNHAATAVVKTADDFVASDDAARRDYQRLEKALDEADTPAELRRLGLTAEEREELVQKAPDAAGVYRKTGDRSKPGGDETRYDDYDGRPHEHHEDSTPGPPQGPGFSRGDRDAQQEDRLEKITESL